LPEAPRRFAPEFRVLLALVARAFGRLADFFALAFGRAAGFPARDDLDAAVFLVLRAAPPRFP
jgi:hypothetical protein